MDREERMTSANFFADIYGGWFGKKHESRSTALLFSERERKRGSLRCSIREDGGRVEGERNRV